MLYLSAIVLSFFLSVVLISKRNKTQAENILAAWLCIIGFHLLTFYLFFTDQHLQYPDIVALGIPLPLVHGPFLYLYTSQQTGPASFNKKQLLHFLPVIFSFLMFAGFYLLTFDQKIEVLRQEEAFEAQSLINVYAIYLSGIVYFIDFPFQVSKIQKEPGPSVFQYGEDQFYLAFVFDNVDGSYMDRHFVVHEDKLIFGAVSLFVLWLGYFGMKQVRSLLRIPPGPGRELVYSSNTSDEASNFAGTRSGKK